MSKTRAEIIDSLRRLGQDCRDIIVDGEAWNRLHPDKEPIVADPRLRRIVAAVDRLLAEDVGHGPIAPLVGVWDGESRQIN